MLLCFFFTSSQNSTKYTSCKKKICCLRFKLSFFKSFQQPGTAWSTSLFTWSFWNESVLLIQSAFWNLSSGRIHGFLQQILHPKICPGTSFRVSSVLQQNFMKEYIFLLFFSPKFRDYDITSGGEISRILKTKTGN